MIQDLIHKQHLKIIIVVFQLLGRFIFSILENLKLLPLKSLKSYIFLIECLGNGPRAETGQ